VDKIKICCVCKKEKFINSFSKDKNKKDGFGLKCKECHKHEGC